MSNYVGMPHAAMSDDDTESTPIKLTRAANGSEAIRKMLAQSVEPQAQHSESSSSKSKKSKQAQQ